MQRAPVTRARLCVFVIAVLRHAAVKDDSIYEGAHYDIIYKIFVSQDYHKENEQRYIIRILSF